MSAIGYLPVDWILQFAVLGVVLYFLFQQWRIHQDIKESGVGGALGEFSMLSLVGLFLIAVSEVMDFAIVQYHLPFVWPRLYSVIPQLGGVLLIFVGLTGLLRKFHVL